MAEGYEDEIAISERRKELEQSRLLGIEEGKKQERQVWENLFTDSIALDNLSDSEVLEKVIMRKARLEVLNEIEKLFVHLEGDDITGGGIDGEYLSKENFEALKKKAKECKLI